jgi:hypothetical protein
MIANIFGLHLGCMVRYETTLGQDWFKLAKVCTVACYDDYALIVPIEDCKLILKPLSAITEEDKREFYKLIGFGSIENRALFFGVDADGFLAICEQETASLPMTQQQIPYKSIFWLASRGYDVGIVPDEYKIVEG